MELSTHKFYDMERGVYPKVGKFSVNWNINKILPPVLLVYSHDRRIYHQEVLNLAAPDFLFWENQLALPWLNRFPFSWKGLYTSFICFHLHFFGYSTSPVNSDILHANILQTCTNFNEDKFTNLHKSLYSNHIGHYSDRSLFQTLNE